MANTVQCFGATAFVVALTSISAPHLHLRDANAGTPAELNTARCSLALQRTWPIENTLYFVGSATGETARAGAGTVVANMGLSNTQSSDVLLGDVVRVERLAQSRPAGIPDNTSHIVVVRWGYGPSCALTAPLEVPLPAGSRAMHDGVLRPRQYWSGNMPTIDVFPFHLTYSTVDSAPAVFAILNSLPGDSAIRVNPRAALARLRAWSRERNMTHIAATALNIHGSVLLAAQNALARELRPEVSGTYRVLVVPDSGSDTTRTYLRISNAPSHIGWRGFGGEQHVDSLTRFAGQSVVLSAVTASEQSQLYGEAGVQRDETVEGIFDVIVAPETSATGSRIWRGQLKMFTNVSTGPRDGGSAMEVARDPVTFVFNRRIRANTRFVQADSVTIEARADGTIVLHPAAAFTCSMALCRSATAIISGERVSPRAFTAPVIR